MWAIFNFKNNCSQDNEFNIIIGERVIERQTIAVLESAYEGLIEIVENLYTSAEVASTDGNYIDASLLQAQADLLFQVQENLATVLTEMEE